MKTFLLIKENRKIFFSQRKKYSKLIIRDIGFTEKTDKMYLPVPSKFIFVNRRGERILCAGFGVNCILQSRKFPFK